LASVLGALGGIGGTVGSIVSSIYEGVRTLYDYLARIISIVIDKLSDFAKWYMNLIVEKPELGITLAVLLIYMIT
jgi:hypothetical protein